MEKIAEEQKYDLLIHTYGGPLPPKKGASREVYQTAASTPGTSYDYEGISWFTKEIFPLAKFPYDLWSLISHKDWDPIWTDAPGGRGRLTDPEGTDISWTFWEEYFDVKRYLKTGSIPHFQKEPFYGHLFGRPTAAFQNISLF